MKEKYNIFGLASAIYAIFMTFCLYENGRGITFPLFTAGTLFYFYYAMKQSGISRKKDELFYVISIMLLGISVFLTADEKVLIITKFGIFLLFVGFLLHHFYNDSQWNFLKYLESIVEGSLYAIGSLFAPATDFIYYIRNKKSPEVELDENGKPLPRKATTTESVMLGILISIPLLLVILYCFSKADLVFNNMMNDIFKFIKIDRMIEILFMIIVGFFGSYSVIHSLLKKEIREDSKSNRTREPALAVTFTSIITVVYLIFCGIQIIYLFAGNGTLPEGYTYSQYARQGFYELLFVCMINLAILLICIGLFKESKALKIILSVITVCTYIMIASAAYRMVLYVDAYYFTFLRFMVFFLLAMIGILMAGIFITIYQNKFPLFRYSMIVVTVFTIALSYAHPDRMIAQFNMDHMVQTDMNDNDLYEDVDYLFNLSMDATPVLMSADNRKLLDDKYIVETGTYVSERRQELRARKGIRRFNVSEALARKALK